MPSPRTWRRRAAPPPFSEDGGAARIQWDSMINDLACSACAPFIAPPPHRVADTDDLECELVPRSLVDYEASLAVAVAAMCERRHLRKVARHSLQASRV